jgi:hypothetical protein
LTDPQKNPEEGLLEELRRTYVQDGILQARTPKDKMSQKATAVDGTLRQSHLEFETEVQNYLAQVTAKMSGAQKFQGMIYLAKEISQLLEGGDEAFNANKQKLSELVRQLNEQVEVQKHAAAQAMGKFFNQAITCMSEANTAMFGVHDLDGVHSMVKAMNQILVDHSPQQNVH